MDHQRLTRLSSNNSVLTVSSFFCLLVELHTKPQEKKGPYYRANTFGKGNALEVVAQGNAVSTRHANAAYERTIPAAEG